jgi:pyruvate kinase
VHLTGTHGPGRHDDTDNAVDAATTTGRRRNVGDLLSTDDMIEKSKETVLRTGFLSEGDTLVITAGHPVGVSGSTNLITAVRL